MFNDLMERIKGAVRLNFNAVKAGDTGRSYYASGMARGYADIIESMGHKVKFEIRDESGCELIRMLEIDHCIISIVMNKPEIDKLNEPLELDGKDETT